MKHHGNTKSDWMERARRRHARWVASRVITCHGQVVSTVVRGAWGRWVICGECQRIGWIH